MRCSCLLLTYGQNPALLLVDLLTGYEGEDIGVDVIQDLAGPLGGKFSQLRRHVLLQVTSGAEPGHVVTALQARKELRHDPQPCTEEGCGL